MKKVAVIGARAENGKGIGFHHARIYYELSREGYDIKLAGISRTTQDNADRAKMIFKDFIKQKFKEEYEINAYGDYKVMLEKEQPDIISICSPDQFHLNNLDDVIKHVYNRGAKDVKVMCEKPLATSDQIDWAKRLLTETEEKGILFGENLQLSAIREKLQNEKLNGIPYSEMENFPTHVYWFTEGKVNGEIILDLYPHILSLIKADNKKMSVKEEDKKYAKIISDDGDVKIELMYLNSTDNVNDKSVEKKRLWEFHESDKIRHTFSYEWKKGLPYVIYTTANANKTYIKDIPIEDPLKSSIKRFVEGLPYVGAKKGLENLILVASVLR